MGEKLTLIAANLLWKKDLHTLSNSKLELYPLKGFNWEIFNDGQLVGCLEGLYYH